MNRRKQIKNLSYDSIAAGAVFTILLGSAIYFGPTLSSGWSVSLALATIVLSFVGGSLLIQKYVQAALPGWMIAPVIALMVLALYATDAVISEAKDFIFVLPISILIAFTINLVILLLRTRRNTELAGPGAGQGKEGLLKHILSTSLITFGLPAVYFWLVLTPRVEFFDPGAIEIELDRPSDRGMFGVAYQGPGLYLRYGIGLRGDSAGDYELKVSAYLLSSDTGSFKDESQYLRRARFLNPAGDKDNQFEGPDGWKDLFLPYEVMVNGTIQGGFDHYQPTPLKKLLAINPDTYFAVEVTASVQERSFYPGQKREVLSQASRIIWLDYEHTPMELREQFLRSQWTALLSGEEQNIALSNIRKPEAVPKPTPLTDRQNGEDEPDLDEWEDL